MAKQSPACAAGLCNTLVPHVCQMISSAETLPEGAIESAIDLVTVLIQTGAGNFASIPNLVDIFALVTRLGGADGVELCSADHSVLQNVADCTRAFVEAMPEAVVEVQVGQPRSKTKIAQGWPKLWANFRALVGIFSQSIGPSLAIWADPVQFSSKEPFSCGPLHSI